MWAVQEGSQELATRPALTASTIFAGILQWRICHSAQTKPKLQQPTRLQSTFTILARLF